MANEPLTVRPRSITLRDFAIFQVKLLLDGSKDFVAFWLSIFAIVLDFIAGRGRRPRLFYSVVRASERFDKWINLHSVVQQMDATGGEGGLLESDTSHETFVSEIERLVRGSEAERAEAIEKLKGRGNELKRQVLEPPTDPE